MHTTPPRPSPASPPTSSCRWRRGRPVAARGSVSSLRRDSATCAQRSTVPTLDPNIRPGLWNPAQPLRFASVVTAETYHTQHSELGANPAHLSVDQVHDAVSRIDAALSMSYNETSKQGDARQPVLDPESNDKYEDSSVETGEESLAKDSEEDTPEEIEPLSYQIPEDKLSAAMRAAPKTRASYWSTKLYQGPEGKALNIHYCRSKEVAERVAKKFLKERVVGFDIEWKMFGIPSSIRHNASLIQLACEDRIALFHIALFEGTTVEDLMPPSLKVVLESPDIYKVGVSIKGDFKRLDKYLGIQAQGVFELSRLHNLVQWYEVDPKRVNNRLVGLAAQVHQHLQLPLYKGEPLEDEPKTTSSVRESDWSLPLDLSQIHYAAADAYAGFRLYDALERKRALLKPAPSAILVCDYDNAPKPKAPRKTRKKSVASSDASDVVKVSTAGLTEMEDDEDDDEKESDEYNTASEEFMDSQEFKEAELTNSPQRSDVSGSNDTFTARRVGRIKLPILQGPDPAYPVLPRESTPNLDITSVPDEYGHLIMPKGIFASDTDVAHIYKAAISDDDEFADAELEEALRDLTLDNNGHLKESGPMIHKGRLEQEQEPYQESSKDTEAPENTTADLDDEGRLPATTNLATHIEMPSKTPLDSKSSQAHQPPTPKQPIESAEYILATDWARHYLQATIPSPKATTPSRIRATIPHLRAYHLWHHQQLAVENIARHLRDPPLSPSTVQSYVLQAITTEKLEYDREALRAVILAMPVSQRRGRWRWIAEKVGALL